ncbi:nitroreductase family deazaflavin-dependent oxidoreductase [Rhodococcus erythropolis]|jgi:deazaflavin-dependent oxidoreductase (nitroreductase family)|uniref:nitroreductase family deazaflavin-dependent oxidoreductase n=1 Tax=Rhodococcus erythropolis TaxID=1833 RepID=UPI0008790586|nr:nitroreductase family deazaflavin-dependent oxidoreductase [Rhodococcus erythropolis]MDF2468406.1 nitroreductase family deazaflavin-dependent oxidoreductase [Rhodococcus erythropolis]OFV78056.1 deazaflavin-dependent nitroreductase [Rhodococcus erythropolis]
MSDIYQHILRAHKWIYIRTGGMVGRRLLFGNPTLLIRTLGRKTGLARTSALTYARDGGTYLVVASAGGAAKPPDWLANLIAQPECEMQIGRRSQRVRARITLPTDPDYARRWSILNEVNRGRYTVYQNKTSRTIPIVELAPATS